MCIYTSDRCAYAHLLMCIHISFDVCYQTKVMWIVISTEVQYSFSYRIESVSNIFSRIELKAETFIRDNRMIPAQIICYTVLSQKYTNTIFHEHDKVYLFYIRSVQNKTSVLLEFHCVQTAGNDWCADAHLDVHLKNVWNLRQSSESKREWGCILILRSRPLLSQIM